MTSFVRAGLVIAGSAIGGPIGGLAGGLIGALAFPEKLPDVKGQRIGDQPITTSSYGVALPKIWGTVPVKGNIIDAAGYKIKKKKKKSGGKGGPQQTTTTYSETINYCVSLAELADTVIQIFANGRLIYDARTTADVERPNWLDFTLYSGSDTQQPDPTFESIRGVGNVPAYRGTSYIVFRNFLITEFGTTGISFNFVITRNGTSSQSKTVVSHTGLLTPDLLWHQENDLIIATVNHNFDATAGATYPMAVAINPYTDAVVWQNINTEPDVYYDSTWMDFCAIPRYSAGVPLYQPNEYVVIESRLFDSVTVNFRRLHFIDAQSGLTVAITDWPRTDSEPNFVSMYSDDAVFYDMPTIGAGITTIERSQVQAGFVYSTVTINNPTGYDISGGSNMGLCAKKGSRIFGETAYICSTFESTSTAGQFAIGVAEDTIPGVGADPISLAWTVTNLPVSALEPLIGVWDSINELFWFVENTPGPTIRPRFYTFTVNGTLSSPIDWNSEFGITGNAGVGVGLPFINRALYFDEGSAKIYVVVDGDLYSFPTFDITETPTLIGSTIEGSPLAYHAPTGKAFTGDDSAQVNAHKVGRVTGNATSLEDICDEISEGVRLGVSDYDYSAFSGVLVDGFELTRNQPKKSALEVLRKAFIFDVVPRSGVLTGILRSTLTSSAALDDDDIGARALPQGVPDPITIGRKDERSLPIEYRVEFIDAEKNYEEGLQQARRLGSTGGTTIESSLAVVLSNDYAQQLARRTMHAAHIEAETYSFVAMPDLWGDLQPASVVTVSYRGETYPQRITRSVMADGGAIQVQGERFDASVYTDASTGGDPRTQTNAVDGIGATILFLMDLPMLRNADNDPGVYTAVASYVPGWPGAELFTSIDAANFGSQYTQADDSDVGYATTTLSAHTPGLIDWSTLNVSMVSGALSSIDSDTLHVDPFVNYAAYGAAGRWEIVRFISISVIADDTIDVTGFYRGLLGTGQYTGSHLVSDAFVVLVQDDLGRLNFEISEISSIQYAKAVTIGGTVAETGFKTFEPAGTALLPHPPCALDAQRSGSDWVLTWSRQDRLKARFLQQPAMSESTEEYLVRILDLGGNVVSSHSPTAETFTYSSALQTIDWGGSIDFLKWDVAQVSNVVGAGSVAASSSGLFTTGYDALVTGRSTLVEFWPLDDTSGVLLASDSGSHDMTHTGAPLLGETGYLADGATSIKFIGIDKASVTDLGWTNLPNTKCVEFWIVPDATPSALATIMVHQSSSTPADAWMVSLNASRKINFYGQKTSVALWDLDSETVLELGSTYHVVCNYSHASGGDIEIWINGRKDASTTSSGVFSIGLGYVLSWQFAQLWAKDAADNTGWYQKIALYDTPSTGAEIYENSLTGFGP